MSFGFLRGLQTIHVCICGPQESVHFCVVGGRGGGGGAPLKEEKYPSHTLPIGQND